MTKRFKPIALLTCPDSFVFHVMSDRDQSIQSRPLIAYSVTSVSDGVFDWVNIANSVEENTFTHVHVCGCVRWFVPSFVTGT